jgi:pimeloyl-ACP methyl ester carboxylesterase
MPAHGVSLAPIADCGHLPMYSYPQAMWQQISHFIKT